MPVSLYFSLLKGRTPLIAAVIKDRPSAFIEREPGGLVLGAATKGAQEARRRGRGLRSQAIPPPDRDCSGRQIKTFKATAARSRRQSCTYYQTNPFFWSGQ